jgi:hypothetical protein
MFVRTSVVLWHGLHYEVLLCLHQEIAPGGSSMTYVAFYEV